MEITQLLTHDHREVQALFERFFEARTDERREIAADVISELARHDAVEVVHLYPAIRGLGEDGEKLTELSLGEHHEVRDLLAELDKNIDSADASDYEETWRRLVDAVRDHIDQEESEIFTLMRREIPGADLERMGAEAMRSKEAAPTRPHPATPDGPSAAHLTGKSAAAVDHLRDRTQQRG